MTQVQLLLYGVFRRLLEYHVPLGVSDYIDALRVLEMQVAHGDVAEVVSRRSLRRVCELLWTRGPDEIRLIGRIFDEIALPTPAEIDWATAAFPSQAGPSPPPIADKPRSPHTGSAAHRAGSIDRDAGAAPTVTISFESANAGGSVPLPYPVLPARPSETFVLRAQTVLSARTLAVLWRRYRRMTRSGVRTELDLDATIREWTTRGAIDRPVLRARRVNRARLLILVDASPSMAPWRAFLSVLEQSVKLSRLQGAEVWYFANVPRRSLFWSADLAGAVPADRVYRRFTAAGLLVISDAGAARGFFNQGRVTQTLAFLADANRLTRSVVWVNPMPRDRWERSTAGALSARSAVSFLPLDQPSMIRAIDVLRGIKAH
jgi:uncharacterized protein with von Willebrand factor type A (vWA) domain